MNRLFIVTEDQLRDLNLLSFDEVPPHKPQIGLKSSEKIHEHIREYIPPPPVDMTKIVEMQVNTIDELNIIEHCAQSKRYTSGGDPIYVINGVATKVTLNEA